MEYEFTRNIFLGEYYVRCEMGYEVVARWLQEEIATSSDKIEQINEIISQSKSNPTKTFQYLGQEISVVFEDGEVLIRENCTGQPLELEEDFSIYESESESSCGLVDFESFLASWSEFIR
ncbi:YacL family protein [Vibrio marisflavi]|uniref:Uncharacterized protein n=1 Tax=Vibrio marisflavi CECT 7928 TaxID=634439 RepID=A0ABM9A2M6_9VIBR|nr:YacL family protein [Vibrio marisflavi]CAH0538715.1 hypothetical protein VMF7928_01602 [Vibrio marisflavi CECT 7928]